MKLEEYNRAMPSLPEGQNIASMIPKNKQGKPVTASPTRSVFVDPMQLFYSNDIYPFAYGPSLDIDTYSKLNAMVRSFMLLLLVMSFFYTGAQRYLFLALLMLLFLGLLTFLDINPFGSVVTAVDYGKSELSNIPHAYPNKYGVNWHISPTLDGQAQKCDTGNCLPLRNRALYWDDAALVSRTSKQLGPYLASPVNVKGNPNYDTYDTAVRMSQSNQMFNTYGDAVFDKMWVAPDQTSMDLYMNQVPDQTLISRPFIPSVYGTARTA